MLHGFLVLLVVVMAAGRQASLDVLLRHEPTTLQEKTIKAIENLSHVLTDLQESITKEGNTATPTQAPPGNNRTHTASNDLQVTFSFTLFVLFTHLTQRLGIRIVRDK